MIANDDEVPGVESRATMAARFGEEARIAGFTSIPNVVLKHWEMLGITQEELLFVIHVWRYWWYADELPFPGIKRLAAEMGVSESRARGYSKSLRDKGFLKVTPRYDETTRAQTSNICEFAGLIEVATEIEAANRSVRTAETQKGGAKTIGGRAS